MAAKKQKTLTLTVMTIEDMKARTKAAFSGKRLEPVHAFATRELLWKTLNRMREDVLKVLSEAGPMSIRAIARAVNRDVKAVHGDVQVLLKSRIVRKTEDGLIEFPYERVRVDYDVTEAA